MTDYELLEKLKNSDLTVLRNVQALFEAGKLVNDTDTVLLARSKANAIALVEKSADALQLVRQTYLWMAPKDFDSYLVYLEWNRKPAEKFYLPRRKQLKVAVDGLQALADDRLDELFISCPPRVGKLIADSTPVLTTEGWKKHGDLAVGDYVFSPEGVPVKVIAVHPKYHTTHTVTMTDGSSFKCHYRHEWKVWDSHGRGTHTLETQKIMQKADKNGEIRTGDGKRYAYHLVDVKPIQGIHNNLPVKPYTFGAWIGDGNNHAPILTVATTDSQIVAAVVKQGYNVSSCQWNSSTKNIKDTGVSTVQPYFSGLRSDLRKLGLCYCNKRVEKYIPDCYLTAPIDDRLQLLAGLLDTDGYLMKQQNRYEYSTSYEQIRDGVVSLISTFGWRASVYEVQPHNRATKDWPIETKRKSWRISFNPDMYIPCRLQRKQLKNFDRHDRISIKSIVESEPEQGNCITVQGGMYLVGKRLIPTHNTSLLMFYVTWTIGRDPERSNLYCAYSDTITQAFYNGVLEIINDPVTYLWHDVFPKSQIAATNSKNETINIDRNKRYASLSCRSLYGTLNGAVDVNGILMSDDLLSGIEEALNKDRLVTVWGKVDNNMLSRAKGQAKILWCGTRWSMQDPIGLRIETLQNSDAFKNRRFKIINMPALDQNDESNFDYLYGVGFDTETYKQRRASFERNNDMASWLAQYMGEPIERDGAVFSPEDFRYYNGVLPDGDPDRVFMALDPAWGGGDYVAAPVIAKYQNDLYVIDVVYSNADKKVTQPMVADIVKKHNVAALQVEATRTTAEYAEGIRDILASQGIRINITTKNAPQTMGGKAQRIFDKAPDIRERMIFLDDGKRSKEYSLFMQNVYSFKIIGKNKNDDAPDSLAMAIDMDIRHGARVQVMGRMW